MLIRPDTPPVLKLSNEDARANLARFAEERREDLSGLDRLIGRSGGYISRYLRHAVPRALSEADRRELARYFGVSPSLLGSEPEPAPERVFAQRKLPARRLRR